MPGRIEEDPERAVLARLDLGLGRADLQHPPLRLVQIVHQHVDVELLRPLPSGQVGGRWSATSWNASRSGEPPSLTTTQSSSSAVTGQPSSRE